MQQTVFVYSRRFMNSAEPLAALDDAKSPSLRRSDNEEPADEVVRWTPEQVAALRVRSLPVSPWAVLAMQGIAGLVCVAVGWLFSTRWQVPASALGGAVVVVLPGVLTARGMSRRRPADAGGALLSVMVWEALKIGSAVVLLLGIARFLPALSWPALLITMIVCQKVYWVALLPRRRLDNTARKRV